MSDRRFDKEVYFKNREKAERCMFEALKRYWHYDESSGEFYNRNTGRIHTLRNTHGTGMLLVDGQSSSTAQLVWMWHHGEKSPHHLRHDNGNSADDRIQNLRLRFSDGTIDGKGSQWVARAPFSMGGRFIGDYGSYESAVEALEAFLGLDLV